MRSGLLFMLLAILALFACAWTLCLPRLEESSDSSALLWTSRTPVAWFGLGVAVLFTTLAAGSGNSLARFFTILFGIPSELPVRPIRSDQEILRRKARWLARFLLERPRGFNTPGAHASYGVIAVKATLKRLALRREVKVRGIASAERRRARLVRECTKIAHSAALALAKEQPEAAEYSRCERTLRDAIEGIDQYVLQARLAIQDDLVRTFLDAWDDQYQSGRVPHSAYQATLAEFQQPQGEPPALLPNGLCRGPLAFVFEYGMFAGRVAMAVLFVATLRTPSWPYAVILLVLNLYVVEPVVQKLHITLLNFVLNVSGHKTLDLKRYLEQHVAEGSVFRVPITIPKFSSNPARANLNAIIEAAAKRAGVVVSRVTPFAMRVDRRETTIQLAKGGDLADRLERFANALLAELELRRNKFPLATDVRVTPHELTLSLIDPADRIWDLIGEDASQAFVYLERNLDALRDSVRHLGPKFQPVFIFASNTRDPDVIEYEVRRVKELQRRSDVEYAGRVGFLYLLHGGAWYNFNAYLRRFEAADKDFVAALPAFRAGLCAPPTSPRERLLASVLETLEPAQWATAFNTVLEDEAFYARFEGFDFDALPDHLRPGKEALELLGRRRAGEHLSEAESLTLNRELLFTAAPMRIEGGFFKKVGNDIPLQELLVSGKTRPTVYIQRGSSEHVQDPTVANYVRLWGDFDRYTGLQGSNEEIQRAILSGQDLSVEQVPEIGAVLDDKNEFGPGELEKGVALMLHRENRHIVIGVPRIAITFPQAKGRTISSEHIIGAQGARDSHNTADAQSRVRVFDYSSPAYGKWLKRPRPYLAHYQREVLNAAHALSHDFQQSYFVAGASGRLSGFSEALYGGNHFQLRVAPSRAASRRGLLLVGVTVAVLSCLAIGRLFLFKFG